MFHDLLERMRAEVSGERALDSVRAIARFHRVQASPGYDEAAAWLTAQLESFGLPVETETAPGDGVSRRLGHLLPEGWSCERATATLVSGTTRETCCDYGAAPLSLVLRSAPARGRFPLVLLEDGTEDAHYRALDVRGAVVLTGGAVQRVHELAVVERGAAGILSDGRRLVPPVRDAFDDPDALAYTSFWWMADEPRGWGFVVSPRRGAALRERLRRGERLELEVEIESRRFATPMPLISTRLPGRSAGEILVVAHLCHPRPSANDNASGAAAALETARVLGRLRDQGVLGASGRSIRVLWVPELTGSYAWMAGDPERARAIAAGVNLDMVGQDQQQCGSTFLLEHPPCFAASFAEELMLRIREQAVDWVPSSSGPGHYSLTRMAEVPYSGGSDHVVFIDPLTGVPCPMLIQWPDRYYHSSHDTPDKTDPGSLALAVRCAATYAAFLATLDARRRDWLVAAVGRGARRRLLRAADEADAARAIERERQRGRTALTSLARLEVAPAEIESAIESLEAFARREAPASAAGESPAENRDRARPRRALPVPLHSQRWLIEGFRDLPRADRERWRRLELDTPDGLVLADLGWAACDGRRTLAEIERLVWLETGAQAGTFLHAWFELLGRIGLVEWAGEAEGAWNPSAPSTATR